MKTDPKCPTGKYRYLSWTHAQHDATAMRRSGKRDTARPYHCRLCAGTHVGGQL